MARRKLKVSKEEEEGEEEVRKQKILIEDQRPCPHCGNVIRISWTRVTKIEPVKGEYEHRLILERSLEEGLEKHLK